MKTRELLQELLNASGDNPNSLSTKLNGATKQPQIHKFLRGMVADPRRNTLKPIADFYGINVEAFFSEELAEQLLQQLQSGAIKLGRPANRHTATPTTNTETAALKQKLKDWRMTASPRSAQVIDQLTLLAEKNALREEDWTLIEQMARRMKTLD